MTHNWLFPRIMSWIGSKLGPSLLLTICCILIKRTWSVDWAEEDNFFKISLFSDFLGEGDFFFFWAKWNNFLLKMSKTAYAQGVKTLCTQGHILFCTLLTKRGKMHTQTLQSKSKERPHSRQSLKLILEIGIFPQALITCWTESMFEFITLLAEEEFAERTPAFLALHTSYTCSLYTAHILWVVCHKTWDSPQLKTGRQMFHIPHGTTQ